MYVWIAGSSTLFRTYPQAIIAGGKVNLTNVMGVFWAGSRGTHLPQDVSELPTFPSGEGLAKLVDCLL